MEQACYFHGVDLSRFHVAIIMDGNGRWALQRGLDRARGHLAGADAVRRTVEAAAALKISDLTLFAFSSDNWSRPRSEVFHLMRLFHRYLFSERQRCVEEGVRVSVIGRRDRLPGRLVRAIEQTERATIGGTRLHLRLAVDYSSRDIILRAAAAARSPLNRELMAQLIAASAHTGSIPDVDLLIRTGREKRLSDFLLWECAYAELYFTDRMWPDFDAADLAAAVSDYGQRQRRFGAVPSMLESHVA